MGQLPPSLMPTTFQSLTLLGRYAPSAPFDVSSSSYIFSPLYTSSANGLFLSSLLCSYTVSYETVLTLYSEEGGRAGLALSRRESCRWVLGWELGMEGSQVPHAREQGVLGVGPSCLRASKSLAFAGLSCIFALGGATVGTVTGALLGQTTETGLVRGAGIGAVAGAVVSVELMETFLQGEPLSKLALVASLLNGKIFREWVSPAMLKAYQWQVGTQEIAAETETSDLFDTSTIGGVPLEVIERLTKFEVCTLTGEPACGVISCAICLQDFKDGESARRLPPCRHIYHTTCIDQWLVRHTSCPICRQDV